MASKNCEEDSTTVSVFHLKIPTSGSYASLSLKHRKAIADRAAYNYDLWKQEKDSAKTVFDPRRLKHVKPLPKWGYLRRTAEEFFPDLKGLKRDPDFISASLNILLLSSTAL